MNILLLLFYLFMFIFLLYCYCHSVMYVTVMPVSAYMALAFVFGFIQINCWWWRWYLLTNIGRLEPLPFSLLSAPVTSPIDWSIQHKQVCLKLYPDAELRAFVFTID